MVEIATTSIDAPDDIKQFFQQISACSRRLQGMKVAEIDSEMPELAGKFLSVRQAILYRAIELQNATALLINADNLLGALIMVRTLVELMALAGELREAVASGVRSKDLEEVAAAIRTTNFSMRWEEMPEDARAAHILTLLQRFDRDFMGGGTPASGMHAALSAFAHPDWTGMEAFFGTVDQTTGIRHFSTHHKDRGGLFVNIAGGYVCLLVIERLVGELAEFTSQIRSLCEDQGGLGSS